MLGNPDGDEKPNKKYYDPRMALRRGEEFMAKRLVKPRPYPSALAPTLQPSPLDLLFQTLTPQP